MPSILAVAQLTHVSGFVDENFQNTFAVSGAPGDSAAAVAADVSAAVVDFYNDVQASAFSLAEWIGQGVSRAADACVVRCYDISGALGGGPHGSPVLVTPFTLSPATGGTAPLPEEVALVCTLRGMGWQAMPVEVPDGSDPDATVDRPKSRVTGRFYLGPINNNGTTPGATKARPNPSLRATLLDAMGAFSDAMTLAGHAAGVWSRKNAEITPLETIQVDDAWDVQRRRGIRPSVRESRTIS